MGQEGVVCVLNARLVAGARAGQLIVFHQYLLRENPFLHHVVNDFDFGTLDVEFDQRRDAEAARISMSSGAAATSI